MSDNGPPKPDLNPKANAPSEPPPEPTPKEETQPVAEQEEIPPIIEAGLSDRLLGGLVDGLLVVVVSRVSYIGPVIGIVYWLLKDALPFTNGLSIGKMVMKTRAVDEKDAPLTNNYAGSCVRNLSLVIPFVVFYEIYLLYSKDQNGKPLRRLGDDWGKSRVIKESYTNSQN